MEAYLSLGEQERKNAAARLTARLVDEQAARDADPLSVFSDDPSTSRHTRLALQSIAAGETYPSYLRRHTPHEGDPNYSTDCSTEEAMAAYHWYDQWCQVAVQTLVEARGSLPLEDLYSFSNEADFDYVAGRSVNFRLSVYGKNVELPDNWRKQPVSSLQARKKVGKKVRRVRMQLRTMYLFLTTAAVNLRRAAVSGIGIFAGAVIGAEEVEITIIPLLIGAGGLHFYSRSIPNIQRRRRKKRKR